MTTGHPLGPKVDAAPYRALLADCLPDLLRRRPAPRPAAGAAPGAAPAGSGAMSVEKAPRPPATP
jgi:hypothetical protein